MAQATVTLSRPCQNPFLLYAFNCKPVVKLLARVVGKMNYLTLSGMLAGPMTDHPPALSYATVYPLAMFLRIISPQLLAVLFWAM